MRPDERASGATSARHVARAGGWLCLAGAALGTLGVLGWITGRTYLPALFPDEPPMMPNTSVALILLGLSGALLCEERPSRSARTLSFIAAALVAALGIGTLVQFMTGAHLHLDHLLMRVAAPPAPATAVALSFLALAILAFDARPHATARPSDWLVVSGGLAALIGLTGQILGAGPMYRLPRAPVLGLAVPTAVSLFCIAIGLLLARPGAGVMAIVASRGSGGVMLRRLALPTVLVPIAIGFVMVRLFATMRVDNLPLMVAAVAVGMIVVGLLLLTVTAGLLNKSYEALRASEAQTRDIIANAADGIFIADPNGCYTAVNAAGCTLLGVTEREIVGRHAGEFLAREEIARLDAARDEMRAGGIHMAEWHLRHQDGHLIPVEVSARFLPSGQWQALVRNISKRKAAEEKARQAMAAQEKLQQELREARSFLENVLQSSTEHALIALDLERRIVFWNAGAARMFGYTAEEVKGVSADVLHDPADLASGVAPALYARAFERGSAEATMRRRRKDGAEFLSRLVLTRRTMADGSAGGYLLVSRDVTREQREIEHERMLAAFGLLLASSLERDPLILSAAKLLVREFADACVVDIAQRPEAEATEWTSKVVHRDSRRRHLTDSLEGIRRDGHPPYWARMAMEERRTTVVSHVTDELMTAIALSDEHLRLMRELAPVSVVSVPLQARGLLLGALTFVSSDPRRRYDENDRDFVQQVGDRLALAMDNARLFEAANNAIKARDEVMGVVAHDLRNPLNTILMQASALRTDDTCTPDVAQKQGAAIERAVKRMNRLITDLLDVAKLEAGRLSIESAAFEAKDLVLDAVEAQRDLAARASLELRGETEHELPRVWADRDRVLQVFENLLSNAIRFTEAGGTIVVGAEPRATEVLFWVSDTGRGIAVEDLPRVFDRFWQARGDKGHGRSAGLGLAIVRGLVEAQRGRVWVESTPGRGSTFSFTLPIARAGRERRHLRPPLPGKRSSASRTPDVR